MKKNSKKEIKEALKKWEDDDLKPRVKKFNLDKSPTSFYTPLSSDSSHFLEKVGFPGQFPYTAGNVPFEFWRAYAEKSAKLNFRPEWGAGRVGKYGGFGTPADYRDYLLRMQSMGRKGGPNIAFDLVTQCGYDSDSHFAEGEVGRVGLP